MKRLLFLLVVTVSLVSACNKEELGYSDFQMTVSAEKCSEPIMAIGDKRDGRMIKKGDSGNWFCSDFPYRLGGFECKEGYEYELLIRETHVKLLSKAVYDQPPYCQSCKLLEVISMTPVNVADE